MKILVFGATGGTGREVVRQGLDQGHEITAFVRRPEALAIAHERLRVAVGDAAADDRAIAQALAGQEAVVSSLGRGNSLRSEGLMRRFMARIVPALERLGPRRFILVTAFGVGDSAHDAPLVPRIMYCTLLAGLFADKKVAEETVRASALDWTIVRPVILVGGGATGRYRAGESLALRGLPQISRADVAHFILGEIGAKRFVRKVVALAD